MDPLERFVRATCIIAIAVLSVYIGIKLLPWIPQPFKNQVYDTVQQWTDYAAEEMTLIGGYILEEPEYPESMQDFIVKVLDTPLGVYSYLTSQNKEHDIGQSSLIEENEQHIEIANQDEMESSVSNEIQKETIGDNPSETIQEEISSEIYDDSKEVTAMLIPSGHTIVSDIAAISQSGMISLEQMLSYDYLIKNFYVIDSSTSMTEEILNPSVLLSKDLSIEKNSEAPQILIYHTHSQEAYIDSVAGDVSQTIVGVGDYLTEILTSQYGYNVLHNRGVYDMENGQLDRNQAYNRALPAIRAILEQYPSIEVVIDLHRDGVAENVHLVTEVNGEPTARIMFFNGVCRDTNGELVDLSNPYREDNLAFSLQMGLQMEQAYPEMLRVLYLQKSRYNQHLASRSTLVEVGAQTNTVAEAMNAMPILAEILDKVLSQ